jgi:hypothetical protein
MRVAAQVVLVALFSLWCGVLLRVRFPVLQAGSQVGPLSSHESQGNGTSEWHGVIAV